MNCKFYEYLLFFNFDIVNFVWKTNRFGEGLWEWVHRMSYFVIFVFSGALIVGGLDAEGLGKKSYLPQAWTICSCLFRNMRVSSRFPWVYDFPGVERFSLDLCLANKKCRKYILEAGLSLISYEFKFILLLENL